MNCMLPLLDMFADGSRTIYKRSEMTFRNGHIDYDPVDPVEIKSPCDLVEASFAFFGSNHIQFCVNDFLRGNHILRQWRKSMPAVMPSALWKQQNRHVDAWQVDAEINSIGVFLSPGQVLYHGGCLPNGSLNRPLSTTLDPSVAIAEALHKGKADACGSVNVYILRVAMPKTCVYVYNQSRGNLAHEREVLFASGARIDIDSNFTEVPFPNIPGRIFNAQIA